MIHFCASPPLVLKTGSLNLSYEPRHKTTKFCTIKYLQILALKEYLLRTERQVSDSPFSEIQKSLLSLLHIFFTVLQSVVVMMYKRCNL